MSFNNRKKTTIDISKHQQQKLVIRKVRSNIIRISKLIPGIYISFSENTICITGRTEKCLSKCVEIIQSIISNTKFTITFPPPLELVGYIIGRQGIRLKNIQHKCGNGCFIYYDNDLKVFNISAFNQNTLKLAIIYLENYIRNYYKNNYSIASKFIPSFLFLATVATVLRYIHRK